jgi:uncharacterized protein YndB with AHSA1/START domain
MAETAPTATGRREQRDDGINLVLDRSFQSGIDEVWAAVTEPARLERWIGTWSGDPEKGSVQFRMTFEEGDSVETVRILECDPPRRLRMISEIPGETQSWRLALDLAEKAGSTVLTFAMALSDPADAENVGPGWEYYLDRLLVSERGGDPAAVLWESYYPALSTPYRELFS